MNVILVQHINSMSVLKYSNFNNSLVFHMTKSSTVISHTALTSVHHAVMLTLVLLQAIDVLKHSNY